MKSVCSVTWKVVTDEESKFSYIEDAVLHLLEKMTYRDMDSLILKMPRKMQEKFSLSWKNRSTAPKGSKKK